MRKNLFSETFNCERKVQNDENVLRSLNKRVYLRIVLHRVFMTVLLFAASRDWETVKMLSQKTVHRNQINLAARDKVLNSLQMLLDYSDILFISVFIYLFEVVVIVRRQRRVDVKWYLFTS